MKWQRRLSKEREQYFCGKFNITPKQIFRTKVPMKLGFMFSVIDKAPDSMKRALTYEPFSPQMAKMVEEGSMMKQIRRKRYSAFLSI